MVFFVLFYGLMCSAIGQTLNQARICVLWFSANTVIFQEFFNVTEPENYMKLFQI